MKYYSTNRIAPVVDFKTAAINGQAPDKGLYFPESVPVFEKDLIKNLENISNEEIAFRVIRPYVGDTINEEKLFQIVSETINFPIPLVTIDETISTLELFHGPTLAFKDVGARFMSRCLGYFVENGKIKTGNSKLTVLVATSGDTGGAVADGFFDVEGVEVVILYPSGKVSGVQEKQLTTLGKNIHALEVMGSFDDCQQMVKAAFADAAIKAKRFLTSANSINVARWLPQQFYYFFAYKQWADKNHLPVCSVPSGNFGNICAGILAMQSGLPVTHFIASCNVNDIVSSYLINQEWKPRPAVATLSNAMDVGNPSNFIRILEIFKQDFPALQQKLSSFSVSDEETLTTISEVYKNHRYLLDPHGAVGYTALKHYLEKHKNQKGFFLETAHPVKFPEAVLQATGEVVEIPSALSQLMQKEKKSTVIKPDFEQLKEYLLQG